MAEIDALRPRYRFTVKEFARLFEWEILDPKSRFELIEGEIFELPPIGPPHANTVNRLAKILIEAVGEEAGVTIQSPILLGESSQPQPDICLVSPREVYFHRHPETEDVLLVIEVSESSAAYDRIKKGRLYSRAWIPEYWLIDLVRGQVEVYRSPGAEGYAEKQELRPGDHAAPLSLPDVSLDVGEILGT